MSHPAPRQAPPAWLVVYTLCVLGGVGRILRLLGADSRPPALRRGTAGPDGAPPSPPPPGGPDWPLVSIVVPVRNEARNLPALLPSLLTQAYPPDRYEVIAVDDQSTDQTPAILADFAARYPQLSIVSGRPLPAGWKGKPWALHQGIAHARGEWLLCTDADTVHSPASLATSVYDAVTRGIDLYTITPRSIMVGPAERLIMPIVYLGIFSFYNPSAVNDPRSPTAIANGQYILIRRAVYDAVGGIAAVRQEIAEDLELARRVKRSGYRLYLADGRNLMQVRMYQNLAEIWEGWRKNVLLSMKTQPVLGVAQIATLVAGVLPFAFFALYLTRALARPAGRRSAAGRSLGLSGVQIAALLLMKRRLDQTLELPWGWTFAYPLGMLSFAGILLDSLRRLLTGAGVTWKGRSYTE